MSISRCENCPSLVAASFNVIPSFSDPAFLPFCVDQKVFLVEFPSLRGAYVDHKSIGISIVQEQAAAEEPVATRGASAQQEERGPEVTSRR